MPDASPTSFVPLFDRLSVPPGQATARMSMDGDQVRTSIRDELLQLFATRLPCAFGAFFAHDHGVLDYGIPDSSAMSMDAIEDRRRLEAALALAIARFEPRLSEVSVSVAPSAERGADALVRIDARLRLGRTVQHATFFLDPRRSPDASGAGTGWAR